MTQMMKTKIGSDDKSRVLLLPYAAHNLSMAILLPKQRFALSGVEQTLTSSKLFELIDKAGEERKVLVIFYVSK